MIAKAVMDLPQPDSPTSASVSPALKAGRLELDDAPFDVLHLVDDTMGLVAETARKQGIALSSLCENSVPNTAVGDSGRIAQVLLNLVSNAVKFTEQGEVFVRVTGRPISSEKQELSIAVRDTGIGIDAENLERLFDSFRQAEASISRRYGGTGLGLAIAKQLCELMGGTLRVESTVGEGSTFTATVVVGLATPDWKRHDVRRSFPGMRALVVGQSVRADALLRFLGQWGAQSRGMTASEALMRVRSGPDVDVVFVFDGLDAIDPSVLALELRSVSTTRPIHIALVTSSPETEHIGMFDSVLSEPLRQSHVYDVLVSLRAGPTDTSVSGDPHFDPSMGERTPLRILVAEDNHVNQKVLLSQLRNLGYSADAVTSGAEAVDANDLRPYDVILMDVHMPEMDGVTATRLIRERSGGAGPAIIAVSADATTQTKATALEAGVDDYVTKPIKIAELAGALRRNAGGRRSEGVPATEDRRPA
jgi:CheY-like chemotaxis protein/anti-sigma regulatory factor (Ser/Thr protein kinase)